eukprot:TRINITY_DN1718_c0_g1_i3.p1 TRINITY_DN1718_c0_g1~~TRINITY_DN1718_c0_g1_i3.p1  ORF type:complete len:315 (-),score=29.47 TRINITY_DN1718_c0_g1_i3:338-1282(-)
MALLPWDCSSIPAHLRDRRVHKYHSNQMKHSLNESDIVRELLPLLQAHGALQVLNWHKQPTNIMAPHLQRLRCRANFHALRYIPEIMRIAELVVQELRRAGTFFAVHLRFEADWMVHYACSFNTTTLRTQEDPSGPRMRPCLLTPGEVALILKAVGADQDTTVYLASGEIFEAKVSMTPFLEQLPKTVRREAILQRLMINESLHINSTLVETHGWIIDYVVSVESDILIESDDMSNWAHVVTGERFYNSEERKDRTLILASYHLKPLVEVLENDVQWDKLKTELQKLRSAFVRSGCAGGFLLCAPLDCMCPLSD